ncbi:hypothetical protein L6452_04475 [Arctium lappa]|uniref:Uncharacterized protein n=1 Tax=Arctium lappa TaxID=4217 RepID=A0ACB9EEF8_ARCLA|nr:hypothetical protein L6452_04475 [Arctium lappa]
MIAFDALVSFWTLFSHNICRLQEFKKVQLVNLLIVCIYKIILGPPTSTTSLNVNLAVKSSIVCCLHGNYYYTVLCKGQIPLWWAVGYTGFVWFRCFKSYLNYVVGHIMLCFFFLNIDECV